MEEKSSVPYIVYEGTLTRMERQIKRLWIALVVAVSAIAVTNLAWIYYESQFETITYSQDGDGINNVNAGEQGDLNNGAKSEDKETTKPKTKESENPRSQTEKAKK